MPDEDILHQDDVEQVIDEVIEAGIGENQSAIADLAAPSPTYVEAESLAARNKINAILGVLRNAGIIDTA
jgi:hypothetical protein